MATRTANTGTNNWNTNAAWVGGVQPTTADDVVIPSGATVPVPASATVQAKSLTVASGATWNMGGSSTLQLGTSTPGAGNVAISIDGGATSTGNAGTIQLLSTSATQQTIATGGKTLPGIQQAGVGSSYLLSDALTCGAFTISAGTLDTGSYTITWTSFAHSGTGTKVFSPGSSVITCTSGNTPVSHAGSNFTISSNTCTWKCTPTVNQATWTAASGTYKNVENNTAVAGSFLSNALSCENFTYTSDASQARVVQFSGAVTCSDTFTITGNSAINRPSVISSVIGTARTITAAATAITGGVDWADITAAGAAAPFVAASGYMGDRLGNTDITLTTPATQTRAAAPSAVWSDASKWTSRVPLPQDDVVFDASSANCTGTDVLCLGKSLDFSAYTNTLTLTSSSTEYQVFGDVELGAGMAFGSAPNTFYIEHRSRSNGIVTSNGQPYFRATSNQRANFWPVGSSYTLTDDLYFSTTSLSGGVINHYAGTLDLGTGLAHTGSSIASATTTYTRSIICGAGTSLDCPATGAAVALNFSSTNLSTTLQDLTVNLTGASATTKTLTTGPTAHIGTVNYTVADSPAFLSLSASTGTKITNLNLGSGRGWSTAGPTWIQTLTAAGADFNGQKMLGQAAGELISTPDAAALDINTDIRIECKVTLADWTPAGTTAFLSKINAGLTAGYCLRIGTTGILTFFAAGSQVNASTATAITDGDTYWIAVDRRTSDGRTRFWKSPDGSSWTQIGTDVTLASGTSIGTNSDALYIGSRNTGNDNMGAGQTFHRAKVYSDITGTTCALDANFETKTVGADTFTESSANAATVTIGGTGALKNGDGRLAITSTVAGTPAYLSVCDRPTLDYVKTKDIFSITQGKLYVGANGTIGTGCTNVHTGAFTADDPYVRQHVDVSGTAFAFPVLSGSLLAAGVTSTTASPAWATPSGYTVIARNAAAGPNQIETYSKVADGSETAFTTTTTGGAVSVKCWEIVGANAVDVIDENSASTVTTLDAASAPLSTSAGKTLGVALWGGNAFGASGTYTDGYGESRNATLASHFRAATRPLAASATTDPNFSWTGNQNPRSQLLVFKLVSTSITVSLGRATTTDTAHTVARTKARPLGRAATTDTARALGRAKGRTLGRAVETDIASALARLKRTALGRAVEVDTARPQRAAKGRTLARAVEVDTARSLGRSKQLWIATASEADLARALVASGGFVAIRIDSTTLGRLGTPTRGKLGTQPAGTLGDKNEGTLQ